MPADDHSVAPVLRRDGASAGGPLDMQPLPSQAPPGAIYRGRVVHKRLRPVPHALDYGVFALWLDCDRLDELSRSRRWFSHNRFNVVSFHDADHGPGDGTPPADHVRGLCATAGLAEPDTLRVHALCYPRVFGYVFNPLTVYFATYPGAVTPAAIVYEVNNTFGDRRSYVAQVRDHNIERDGQIRQHAAKELFVSPFNRVEGTYRFHVTPPGGLRCVIGILLDDGRGPLLKAHFAADRVPLTDGQLLSALVRYPAMTLKVMVGIHLEALKLLWKGLRLNRRPRGPAFAVTQVKEASHE